MVGLIDWGTVLSKNPDKRKYLLEILPIENFNIKVLSCIILKESPRHGETDLLAQVQIDACSPEGVANFISSFEDKSCTTLKVKKESLSSSVFYYSRIVSLGAIKGTIPTDIFSSKKFKMVTIIPEIWLAFKIILKNLF